jgi:hypothetical protein
LTFFFEVFSYCYNRQHYNYCNYNNFKANITSLFRMQFI